MPLNTNQSIVLYNILFEDVLQDYKICSKIDSLSAKLTCILLIQSQMFIHLFILKPTIQLPWSKYSSRFPPLAAQ